MLLFGFALVYAATGDLTYAGIGAAAGTAYGQEPLVMMVGSAMILAGLGFKLSVVPFHMWTPDVYQGAPTPVTVFLATVSKGAVFVALSRFYVAAELYQYSTLILALSIVAAISMLFGNWLALQQDNIKRLLAYSSIAHFGYLLLALIAMSYAQAMTEAQLIGEAVTFYLTAYILTTLTAFAVVTHLSGEDEKSLSIGAFDGLFWRQPLQACGLSVALLSFAGIPLTAGFIGKFYLINVAIQSQLWVLMAALVLGSAIGIYYYLRFIFAMSKTSAMTANNSSPSIIGAQDVLTLLLLVLVIILGSWPQPFIEFAGRL